MDEFLLRLPTGIWYSAGVKANVLFFDKRPHDKQGLMGELWIYDLRTNKNFTLREKPISNEDMADFVECCHPTDRTKRKETSRFKRFTYQQLFAREKTSFDIFWLKENSTDVRSNRSTPQVLARAIVKDLEAAMLEFSGVERELDAKGARGR
jgi:type I restriction enzyme M protein